MTILTPEELRDLAEEIEQVHDTMTDGQLAEALVMLSLPSETLNAHAVLIEAARRLNYRNG